LLFDLGPAQSVVVIEQRLLVRFAAEAFMSHVG
jgi:hypothetical protein